MPSLELFGNHPVSVKVLFQLKKAEQQTGNNKVKVNFEKSPVQGPEWRWFKKHLMPKGLLMKQRLEAKSRKEVRDLLCYQNGS